MERNPWIFHHSGEMARIKRGKDQLEAQVNDFVLQPAYVSYFQKVHLLKYNHLLFFKEGNYLHSELAILWISVKQILLLSLFPL